MHIELLHCIKLSVLLPLAGRVAIQLNLRDTPVPDVHRAHGSHQPGRRRRRTPLYPTPEWHHSQRRRGTLMLDTRRTMPRTRVDDSRDEKGKAVFSERVEALGPSATVARSHPHPRHTARSGQRVAQHRLWTRPLIPPPSALQPTVLATPRVHGEDGAAHLPAALP